MGGVQIWEAATGGCSQRLVRFRLREPWQQAVNHPGQGTKGDFGLGERSRIGACVRAGPRSGGRRAVARGLTLNCRGRAVWLGVEL